MAQPSTHTPRNPAGRRWTSFTGIFFDEFAPDSAWIREAGRVQLPPLEGVARLRVRGEYRVHPSAHGAEREAPSLACRIAGGGSARVHPKSPGAWEVELELPAETARRGARLDLVLGGVGLGNLLAWLGRLTGFGPWQHFRRQAKNRQLRLTRIETGDGEVIYDFSQRLAPYSVAFARRHMHLGLNIAGFLTADLGVGESARCMVRAADAARLPVALVPLKLHCKNRLGDDTYAARLQERNPHDVNVFHLDPPSSGDIDHHHGRSFRAGKHNVAYWAWELPDFPDAWMPAFDFFDEVWCPSDFTREAIAMKSPVPVLTMPHAIAFERPAGNFRPRFQLPADPFLFLFVYDLNSYSERKNPRAVIEAFRQSGLAGRGAALVVKVQNTAGNESDFAALQSAVADLPGTRLIAETLTRAEIYQLESACDCFVSLHRAEGFGLAVAECMYLGKPVISTDWSATAEYVTPANGCPVRCRPVTLERNHGPYMKGSTWADPDVAHAAECMRRVFSDRALAAQLGAAARATIETRFAPAVIGARYRRRLESIAWF
ncbi:MAG TPA: glycosyltransferase family 4 protein [Opitutaceae bacterium]|nr:glycosyltransferase family 4 protein [Opitutaceae bacterium]